MRLQTTTLLLLLLVLVTVASSAQTLTGFWLGIASPSNSSAYPVTYALTIAQSGSSIHGITQAATGTAFNETATLSGNLTSSSFVFIESPGNGTQKNTCFWKGSLVYNPTTESLTGTYETIGNSCNQQQKGTLELYRIILQPDSVFCSGSPVKATVTGKNIHWYTTAIRTTLLTTGNTYTPQISQTTTFYITQTLNQIESPAVPVTIKIENPAFKTKLIPAGCGRASGSIIVVGANAANWQYSLNNTIVQADSTFGGLFPGNYTVSVKTAAGCRSQQSVTLTSEEGPTVSNLKVTSPHCASANGEVVVEASGGKLPLTYSIDYGNSFQSSPIFDHLSARDYTVRTRDANGCEVNKAVSLTAPNLMVINDLSVIPTTCGQDNGQATVSLTGGSQPIQYSLDNQPFQPSNAFSNLKAGAYTLTAKDGSGCTLTQPVRIASSTGPRIATVDIEPEACEQQNGAIRLILQPPADSVSLSIDGYSFQQSNTFAGLQAGNYIISLKDNHNCLVSQKVVVSSTCPNLIHLPTAFSPNADQQNDQLTIYFRFSSITILRFTVYDRWGTVMYNRANFVLTNGESIWDGQWKGLVAPAGMYVCQLHCEFPDGTQTTIRQTVSLLH